MRCDSGHELWEQETACADGLCPLCLVAEVERLKALVEMQSASREGHPTMCCGQCADTVEQAERERDEARAEAEAAHLEVKRVIEGVRGDLPSNYAGRVCDEILRRLGGREE